VTIDTAKPALGTGLKDCVGLVVGATGGIGGACLAQLAPITGTVVATGRRPLPGPLPPNVRTCRADLATETGRQAITAAVMDTAAPLGYVVIASGQAHRAAIDELTADGLRALLDVNVVAPIMLIKELLGLEWTDPAAIVVIGSLSARRALPSRAAYGASKAALEQFARVAAVELAPRSIAVNTLSVGVVDTPFLAGDRERLERYIADRVPIGRMGNAKEVAHTVAYLVGAPGLLTGATIEMDGGTGAAG